MTEKKICICGWNKAAGKCPYPINCNTSIAAAIRARSEGGE